MLRFCDSYDHYTTTAQAVLKGYVSMAGSIVAGGGRNGTACYRNNSNTNGGQLWSYNLATNEATIIVGQSIKVSATPQGEVFVMAFVDTATVQCYLTWSGTDGLLRVRRGGATLLGTGTTVLAVGVAYYIEVKATIHSSAGRMIVKLNGATEIDTGGGGVDTNATANNYANIVYTGADANYGGGTVNWDHDDLYICDTSGTYNNDFLGDIRVQAIVPTADGAHTDFTPSSASTHFDDVDEATPNDDTDYVESSTVNHIDTYTYSDVTPTSGTVKAAVLWPYARKTDAGTRTIAPVTRASGADSVGANLPNLATTYKYYGAVYETNPATGNPWTITEINALEAGIKVIA